jgi:multiple sugar transport system permease protein
MKSIWKVSRYTKPQSNLHAKSRWGSRFTVGRLLAWCILLTLIFLSLFPLWWVFRTALTPPRMVFTETNRLFPTQPTLDNFARVLGLMSREDAIAAGGSGQTLNFLLYLRNTVIVTFTIVIGQVLFSAMAAYAFARLRFPGRDQIFFLYLSALMLPPIVTLIPNFVLIRDLGWLNTFQGIIAPSFFMTPFGVFFLRQFFLSINRELEEAAKLDGASTFGIFWRIIFPMSKPPLLTLAILTLISNWNDFLWPFLVGRDENVRVLNVGLAIFRSQTPQGAPDWTGLMAGTAVTILPVLVILLILGRRVIDSLQFGGFK